MDWALQPSTYKNYPNSFEKFELDQENPWHSVIYHAVSISTKKYYPTGTHRFLRVNPSAGALYPNELYFQARGVEGFEDGVYHYEVETNRFVLLYRLKIGEGIEPYMGYETAMKGLLFLVSAVYYRSSWKYKNRAFRYCLLDAGHVLGSLESSAILMDKELSIVYDIKRRKLNEMFSFASREYFLSGAVVATPLEEKVKALDFELIYIDGSGTFEQNEHMESAYRQTSHLLEKKAEHQRPKFDYEKVRFKESILKRRSQRGFEGHGITKEAYKRIMQVITEPILSDCDEEVELFVVLNKVHHMPVGLYHNGKLLKNEDLSQHGKSKLNTL
jgi:SagB-type dehydrogenase family enzyme